jgi:hypothetical protein
LIHDTGQDDRMMGLTEDLFLILLILCWWCLIVHMISGQIHAGVPRACTAGFERDLFAAAAGLDC